MTLGTAAKETVISTRQLLAGPVRVIWAIGVALAYFVTARLSLALLEPADGVAVFWPAAGVASGILIALGPAAQWPVVVGVVAATIAANLLGDRNIGSSVFSAVANAGDAVIVAGLIHRFCGSPFNLNELRRVLALFAAAAVSTSLSGIMGTVGFVLFHGSAASPPVIWFHWFSSDAIGIIAVAPFAIGLASFARNLPPRREIAEGHSGACCDVPRMCVAGFPAQRDLDRGAGDWRALPTAALDRSSASSCVHCGCHVHHCDHDCLDHNLCNRHFRGLAPAIEERVSGGPSHHPQRSHWAPWFLRPCLASGGFTKPDYRTRCGPAEL